MTNQDAIDTLEQGIAQATYLMENGSYLSEQHRKEVLRCMGNTVAAYEMAIAALKEQEPRVLTLDELKKNKESLASKEAFPVWYESKLVSRFSGWEQLFYNSGVANYGMLWRFWTRKPTPEQMAATHDARLAG